MTRLFDSYEHKNEEEEDEEEPAAEKESYDWDEKRIL